MDDSKKLEYFINNSSINFLTESGVNNVLLLTATLLNGVVSPYIFYDFNEGESRPLTNLCIKIIFVSGGPFGTNVYYPSSKSLSSETITKECETQNEIYFKSGLAYDVPICPPIINLEFSLGKDVKLLLLLLSRINFKKNTMSAEQRNNNKTLKKYLTDFIMDKEKYRLSFVVMEYIKIIKP